LPDESNTRSTGRFSAFADLDVVDLRQRLREVANAEERAAER
jgi:hypothetical protein